MKKYDEIVSQEINGDHFRVAIFGSARIQPDDITYQQVYQLAKKIGSNDLDILTGGGPGLMEAANTGHYMGKKGKNNDSHSFGLTIKLPHEQNSNKHLDIKLDFNTFSERLLYFMKLSNVVVVAPGGIGTCLELMYTWQLTQVEHIPKFPIILLGDMWKNLIHWVKEDLLKNRLISVQDMDNIYIVENNEEAMEIIMHEYGECMVNGKNMCDIGKFKLLQEE